MSESRKVLGRGLGALLRGATDQDSTHQEVKQIAVNEIVPNPFQPRRSFSLESIQELAESIQQNDLIQPILLRYNEQHKQYEIVAGERRYRAFCFLEKSSIPAIVRNFDDQEMLVNALIENVQREDLSPVEEAHSYQNLITKFALTHEDLANTVGKSRSHISNSLRLLKLPDAILDYLESGLLSPGAARALLPLEGNDLRKKIASEVIVQGLNVRQIERYVRDLISKSSILKEVNTKKDVDNTKRSEEETLQAILGYPCKIKTSRKGHRLEIEFKQENDLITFISKLKTIS